MNSVSKNNPPCTPTQQTIIKNGQNSSDGQLSQPMLQTPSGQIFTNQCLAMNTASPVLPVPNPQYLTLKHNSQHSVDMLGLLNTLIQKTDIMDKKLCKLETIQTSASGLSVQGHDIKGSIKTMESKISDIEKSRQYDSTMLDEIRKNDER
ncbi:hypothetical protein ACF0H5_008344 [Mactra antiquata]